MKPRKAFIQAILLLILTASWTASVGQESKTLSMTEYKQLIDDVNIGNRALRELASYKIQAAKDSSAIAALQSLLQAKEEQLQANGRREQVCQDEKANLSEGMKSRDFIIEKQRTTIDKLAKKDKRLGLGVGVGYAFGSMGSMSMGIHGMPSLTVGITYNLIRF